MEDDNNTKQAKQESGLLKKQLIHQTTSAKASRQGRLVIISVERETKNGLTGGLGG